MEILQQIIFLAILGLAVFLFSRKIMGIKRNISLGYEEKLTDQPLKRWKNVFLLALGQKKMFKNPLVAILHLFIYLGFIIINIEILEIISDGIFGSHRLFQPLIPNLYPFLINIFELLLKVFSLFLNFLFSHQFFLLVIIFIPRLLFF
jgi:hypothetical protein